MSLARLLLWRLRLAWAGTRGRGGRRRILAALWAIVVGWVSFAAAWVWTHALLSSPDARELAPLLVLGILHATLFLSLLRDTAASLGHLFLSPDVPLLLAAPLSPRSAVALKGTEALADALGFPVVVALPVLLGYGAAVGAPPVYFLVAPFVLLALFGVTVGSGFLISLSLAPWVPAGRVRQWIRGTLAIFYLGVWVLLVLGTASRNAGWAERFEPSHVASAESGWSLLQWSPSQWAGEALVAIAGRTSPLPDLLRLAGLVAALLLALGLLANLYPTAWQRAQELSRHARRTAQPARRARSSRTAPAGAKVDPRSKGIGPGLALALPFGRRDAKLVVRDPNLIWDIALLLVMTSFLPLLVAPALADRPRWLVVPALLFFATELGYDLGSRAFPLERRALPCVLAAPVGPGALCVARIASWWVMGAGALVLAWAAVTVAFRLAPSHAVLLLLAAVFLLSGSLPAGLAVGIYMGKPDWRHPRQMLNLGGRLVLLALLLLLCGGLLLAFPRVLEGEWSLVRSPATLGALALAAVGLVALSLATAARKLRRLEWLL